MDHIIRPMLCQLADTVVNDPNMIFEPKLDGARITAVVLGGRIRLFSRSGSEKTNLFPDLNIDVTADCILDGEVLSGTSFNDMQHRVNRESNIEQAIKEHPARYSVFDAVEVGGVPIGGFPLMKRKEILQGLVRETDNVSLTKWVDDGVALFELMKANGLEGVVGKAKDGTYRENKRDWLKVKCWQEDKFFVMGYTPGTGWRAPTFGALVLADAKGQYVGQVGTGFDNAEIGRLFKSFIFTSACPFARTPQGLGAVTWVKPFAIKVKFLEITADGALRFPAYKGVV